MRRSEVATSSMSAERGGKMTDRFAIRKDVRQVGLLCSQEGLTPGQSREFETGPLLSNLPPGLPADQCESRDRLTCECLRDRAAIRRPEIEKAPSSKGEWGLGS
jgi:hypothetical protein